MSDKLIDRSETTQSLRFTLLVGLFAICMVWFVSFNFYKQKVEEIQDLGQAEFDRHYELFSNNLQTKLDQAIRRSLDLSGSSLLRTVLSARGTDEYPELETLLKDEWLGSVRLYGSLSQLRFLDLQGDEVFRADKIRGFPEWIVGDALQNQSDRYYVRDSQASKAGIWVSRIDLNIERGRVERPLRPTVRVVTPVILRGEQIGMVVVNYDLTNLFETLRSDNRGNPMIMMNREGYLLSASSRDQEWGWLLDHPEMLGQRLYPELWSRLEEATTADQLQSVYAASQVLSDRYWYRLVYPTFEFEQAEFQSPYYLMFSAVPESVRDQITQLKINTLLVSGFLTLLMFGALFYIRSASIRSHRYLAQTKEALERARTSEQSKADFFSRMSHEIRTPLNGIHGFLQLINEHPDVQKSAEVKRYLREGISSYAILAQVINDLLDFSKIEAGKMKLSHQPFVLDELLQNIGQLMGRLSANKRIDLWFDVDPKRPRAVIGDRIRLSQVLLNLTNNAIKFTQQGEVRVRLEVLALTADEVQLGFEVIDTGIGMSPQQIERIFSPYSQANDETYSKFGGTGLGMAIAKQFIEMMRGEIQVESVPGEGTTVRFNIWLGIDAAAANVPEYQSAPRMFELGVLTDNINAYAIIKRQANLLGWPALKLKWGQDLSELKSHNPQALVLLVDYRLISHEAEVRELIAELEAGLGQVPLLVAVMPHTEEGSRQRENRICDAVLMQPFVPSDLFNAVVEAYQHRYERVERSEVVAQAEQAPAQRLAGLRILLAEDNRVNQMIAIKNLETEGAEVVLAENGLEALEAVENHPSNTYAVVLMDMQMPVMDGVAATKRIKQLAQGVSLPVIGLTANASQEDRDICINAGMAERIAKPYHRDELVEVILRYVKR